jgi:hypothetical protein
MNRMLEFLKFDAFSLKNDQKIDNFATEVWKLTLAEGHSIRCCTQAPCPRSTAAKNLGQKVTPRKI